MNTLYMSSNDRGRPLLTARPGSGEVMVIMVIMITMAIAIVIIMTIIVIIVVAITR